MAWPRILARRQDPAPSWERIVAAHQHPGDVSRACADIFRMMMLSEGAASDGSFLLTSAVESEGKTTLALNLGAMLATRGRRVVLVDLHWRRPDVSRVLGLADRPGLAELLDSGGRHEDFLVANDRLPGLSVLPAGAREADLVRPGLEDRTRSLLDRLKEVHDVVVLDGGPATGPEVLSFSRLVDGVVLVVACDRTPQSQVASAREAITRHGGTLTGAILNRIPPYLPAYYRKV